MSLRGSAVLLTGGTGFIGSAVAAALEKEGARTTLLVRSSSRGERLGALWGKLPKVKADLADPGSLAAALRQAEPEYVLHLAKDREQRGFEPQARATAALAAALAGLPRLRRWVRTAHAGGARGLDEGLASTLAARHGLDVCTLELFLVYGPGQRDGEFPLDLVDAALEGRPLNAPAGAKDLVFVEDVARAYLAAATAPAAKGAWLPIGGGRLISGADVAASAAKAAGKGGAPVKAAAGGEGGHPAPLEKAKAALGWSPSTGLDAGLRKLAAWRQEHAHG